MTVIKGIELDDFKYKKIPFQMVLKWNLYGIRILKSKFKNLNY